MRKDIEKFQLLLVKPDGTELGYLNHSNLIITNTSSIDRTSQISFKLPEYIDTNDGQKAVNPYYGVAKAGFKIKLTIENEEKGTYERMFRISRPQEFTDGTKTSISYSAYSYETILNQKSIPSFAGVALDVDGDSGVSIDINGNVTYTPIRARDEVEHVLDGVNIAEVAVSLLAQTGSAWEVDFIDPDLIGVLRSNISINGTNTLNALKSLQDKYDAVVDFDTINKKVRYYKIDNLGENLGLSVEYGKYLKSLNRDERVDEVITRVKVVGGDNTGIESVSYTGQNYIEDYTYFLGSFSRTGPVVDVSSEWMSDSLALAISDYNDLIDTNKPALDVLLAEKDVILADILTLEINLIYLKIGQDIVEEHLVIDDSGTGKITLNNGVRIENNVNGIGTIDALVSGEYVNVPYSAGIPTGVSGNTYRANTKTIDGEQVPYHGNNELYFDLSEYPVGTNIRISYRSYGRAEIDDTIIAYQGFIGIASSAAQIVTLEAIIVDLNTSRDAQIALINSDESDLAAENANLVAKDIQIKAIQDLLAIDVNFTTTQQAEWENFIIEYTYNNNTINDPDLLLIAAQEILDDRKYPEVIITLDTISILQTNDARVDWDKVNLYDYINIYFDRFNIDVQAKIMEIVIDVDNNDMNLIMSTTKEYLKDNNRLLQKVVQVVSTVNSDFKAHQADWNKSSISAETLDSFAEEGIDTGEYNAFGSNDGSVISDEAGLTIMEKVVIDADWNPEINTPSAGSDSKYGDRFVRIANGGIYLTDDGGKTFNTAITAGQIYADVIKGNLLVGNELLITGNDGSNDILEIGNIDTDGNLSDDDFGVMLDGVINGNDVKIIIGRDNGFKIQVDTGSGLEDRISIDTDGLVQAVKMEITGNDGTSDVLKIGNIDTNDDLSDDDFGVLIKGVINSNNVKMIMARDTGFKIQVDTGGGYEDRFSVDTNGVLVVKEFKITDENDKILLSNDQLLQTLSDTSRYGTTINLSGLSRRIILPGASTGIKTMELVAIVDTSGAVGSSNLRFKVFNMVSGATLYSGSVINVPAISSPQYQLVRDTVTITGSFNIDAYIVSIDNESAENVIIDEFNVNSQIFTTIGF